jgi:hypothetical protein
MNEVWLATRRSGVHLRLDFEYNVGGEGTTGLMDARAPRQAAAPTTGEHHSERGLMATRRQIRGTG